MYKFGIRSSKINLRNGREAQHCLIVIKKSDKHYVVHPLSNVLLSNKKSSYNTQKSKGQALVNFLNWYMTNCSIFKEIEPRLSNLNLNRIEHYLNHLIEEGKSKSTIDSAKKALFSLIKYLESINLLNEEVKSEYYGRINAGQEIFQLHTKLSDRTNNNLIHEIRREYISYFLDLAYKEVNPIALGLCIQMFGGLRRGECVNLTRDSIVIKGAFGKNGLELDLKERNLRGELKDYDGTNGVKKPRKQVVFPNKFLPIFLENHLKTYIDETGNNALFIDGNGKPMTGATYGYYFEKLKDVFIKNLMESKDVEHVKYGLYLNTRKWSSHVCRGTFSNWIAETTSNPMDLALARGDSNINSSLTYMEHSETFMNGVHDVVNRMFEEAKNI